MTPETMLILSCCCFVAAGILSVLLIVGFVILPNPKRPRYFGVQSEKKPEMDVTRWRGGKKVE